MRKRNHQDSHASGSRLRPLESAQKSLSPSGYIVKHPPVTSIPDFLRRQHLGSSWQQQSGCGVLVASHRSLFLPRLQCRISHQPCFTSHRRRLAPILGHWSGSRVSKPSTITLRHSTHRQATTAPWTSHKPTNQTDLSLPISSYIGIVTQVDGTF